MNGGLDAEFEKQFAEGPLIGASLHQSNKDFSVTVLFGSSGCGKTTILRCLAGLERPERGHIRYGGESWFDAGSRKFLPPQQRGIGFLFQDYALFPHLTVAGNVAYGLSHLDRRERRLRVAEILELLKLTGLENRFPRQLSGGQQQRVALARAVVRRPRLLLLDEPLSALDAPTREELRRELRCTLAEFGTPAVIVTHDRNEALALADHVVVLDSGVVRQSGPIGEVFARPADLVVARIVGMDTVVPARVIDGREGLVTVEVGKTQLTAVGTAPPGTPAYVCIRAEDVILETGMSARSSARNRLEGRIVSMAREGPMTRISLDCGFSLAALVTNRACEEMGLAVGATVVAMLKAPSIHLVPRG